MRPPLTQQLLLYWPDRSMVDLEVKRVVLTGASSGIGEAAAEKFARRGARLVVVARRQELLDAVVDRITGIAPGMLERGYGHIINVASWGVLGESSPLFAVYNASKSAVSRVIETEWAARGCIRRRCTTRW